jgi:hypothetical protein
MLVSTEIEPTDQGLNIFIVPRNVAVWLESTSRTKGKSQGFIVLLEIVVHFAGEKSG